MYSSGFCHLFFTKKTVTRKLYLSISRAHSQFVQEIVAYTPKNMEGVFFSLFQHKSKFDGEKVSRKIALLLDFMPVFGAKIFYSQNVKVLFHTNILRSDFLDR